MEEKRKRKGQKKIFPIFLLLWVVLFFVFSSFFLSSVFASDYSQNINVGITVPGGGQGGGDNPPSIFNVSSSTSYTTAIVRWNATDDFGIATSSFVYGPTLNYGNWGVIIDSYQVNLADLATGTLYYFKISVTDTGLNTAVYTGVFKTLASSVHTTPPVISNILILPGMTTATISWQTDEPADSQVNYGLTNAYGNNMVDFRMTLNHTIFLFDLLPSTTYHYRLISTDSFQNSTSTLDATFKTLTDDVPPPDVTNFNLATTSNSIILSWTNPSLMVVPDFAGVKVVRKINSPSHNVGDGALFYIGDGEFFTDANVLKNVEYYYTIFSFDTSGNYSAGVYRHGRIFTIHQPPPPKEICNNGIDDDSNGLIDCDDPACKNAPECQRRPPPLKEICNNGIDDDSNGLIDCDDPVCKNTPECQYRPPTSTVPNFIKINLSDLVFLSGNRQIKLLLSGDTVAGLSKVVLTVGVPKKVLVSPPKSMVLKIEGGEAHQFVFNISDGFYYSDLSFPDLRQVRAYLEVDYGLNQFDAVAFKINGLPWGSAVDDKGAVLANVEVALSNRNGDRVAMEIYGQTNPIITDAKGRFGWMVLNGAYDLTARKDGYFSYSLPYLQVDNNAINTKLRLLKRPPPIIEVIEPDVPLIKNVKNVSKNLAVRAKIISQLIIQNIKGVISTPEVKQTTERVVVPVAIGVVALGAMSFISWLDLLPFLRLLFLQPLMLLGWRKREKWGLVYNSLNKLPVDLAIVRLLDAENNRVIQSKVTNAQGRYIFIVNPGKYKIEVKKNQYAFPSALLAGYKSDGRRVDIYHGEIIEASEKNVAVAANIPLDPAGAYKKPARLIWEKISRRTQVFLSWAGIIVTAASLYISPKWYIGALLGVHVVLFFLFRRLALPAKTKGWGIVYDANNRQPVAKAVARLFNSQFNKLVSTEVTDNKGRYSFLAGDENYYVAFEHKDYQPHKTDMIDLRGKESGAIAVDVGLKKQ